MDTLVIDRRFCGPARSGNGGWTSGALAAKLAGAAVHPEITAQLRLPPPLGRPLPVVVDDAGVRLHADAEDSAGLGAEVGSAGWAGQAIAEPCPPVTVEAATAAAEGYPGLVAHPFPDCFACGPQRAEGDGLRIFPGWVEGQEGLMAAPWTPDASLLEAGETQLGSPITWAALDCVGGWAGGITERAMVLASMTARIDRTPQVGVPHVVVGVGRRVEGRKSWTAGALYDADGLVAVTEQLWIEVDAETFNTLGAQA